MIKLQLLLRHPGTDPGIDEGLRTALDGMGLCVTGCGRATVSAQIAPDAFARLFGPAPDSTALPVPAPLSGYITLITSAPPHCVTTDSQKGKHGAI
ncbi:MAG TPA: hypothetical protein VGC21_00580 [Telluria sp.]|jgi:hypothetical protein